MQSILPALVAILGMGGESCWLYSPVRCLSCAKALRRLCIFGSTRQCMCSLPAAQRDARPRCRHGTLRHAALPACIAISGLCWHCGARHTSCVPGHTPMPPLPRCRDHSGHAGSQAVDIAAKFRSMLAAGFRLPPTPPELAAELARL